MTGFTVYFSGQVFALDSDIFKQTLYKVTFVT